MTATTSSITRTQGDDYNIVATVYEGDDLYPMDNVTEVKLGVATTSSIESSDTPLSLITGTVTSVSEAKLSFTPNTEFTNLEPGTYFAEIQMLDNGKKVTTKQFNIVIKGQIIH